MSYDISCIYLIFPPLTYLPWHFIKILFLNYFRMSVTNDSLCIYVNTISTELGLFYILEFTATNQEYYNDVKLLKVL